MAARKLHVPVWTQGGDLGGRHHILVPGDETSGRREWREAEGGWRGKCAERKALLETPTCAGAPAVLVVHSPSFSAV